MKKNTHNRANQNTSCKHCHSFNHLFIHSLSTCTSLCEMVFLNDHRRSQKIARWCIANLMYCIG